MNTGHTHIYTLQIPTNMENTTYNKFIKLYSYSFSFQEKVGNNIRNIYHAFAKCKFCALDLAFEPGPSKHTWQHLSGGPVKIIAVFQTWASI